MPPTFSPVSETALDPRTPASPAPLGTTTAGPATTEAAQLRIRNSELLEENSKLRAESMAHAAAARSQAAVANGRTTYYDELFDARLQITRLKKHVTATRRAIAQRSEKHERAAMASHDPFARKMPRAGEEPTVLGDEFSMSRSGSMSAAGSPTMTSTSSRAPLGRRRSNVDFQNLKRSYSRSLECTRDTMSAEQAIGTADVAAGEAFLEARLAKSALEKNLRGLRTNAWKHLKDVYDTSCSSMHSLGYIFHDATKPDGILANPKYDFKRGTEYAARETTKGLKQLRRTIDIAVSDLLDKESQLKKQRLASLIHSSAQTDPVAFASSSDDDDDDLSQVRGDDASQSTSVASVSIAGEKKRPSGTKSAKPLVDWAARCAALDQRVGSLERALVVERSKVKAAEARSDEREARADEVVSAISDALLSLHDAAYRAVHVVYKHRFRWTPHCRNNFAGIARTKDFAKASRVLELTEATRDDVVMLDAFAAYFIDDNVFGADLAHLRRRNTTGSGGAAFPPGDAGNARPSVGAPRDAADPLKAFVAFGDDGDADDVDHHGAVGDRGATKHDKMPFRRMEEWTRKQSALWEERRASLHIPEPVGVKLDLTPVRSEPRPQHRRQDAAPPSTTPGGRGGGAAGPTTRRAAGPLRQLSLTPTEPPLPAPPLRTSSASAYRRRNTTAY
jgi:hypothetical protein